MLFCALFTNLSRRAYYDVIGDFGATGYLLASDRVPNGDFRSELGHFRSNLSSLQGQLVRRRQTQDLHRQMVKVIELIRGIAEVLKNKWRQTATVCCIASTA